MAETEYTQAQKLGRRKYQDALLKGEHPYLPVLDNILSYTEIASTVNLGTMDIPLKKLVGTKTEERSSSFAANFMPLLPERSEFGAKWNNLYQHQIEEGIHDPIIAYEFMNRFYVQEGNKRVSVLKYVGAYSVPGTVTRLIPRRTEEKDNRLYYEFLDFYKVSSNCDVWFSRLGSYKKLLKLMGKEPDQVWDQEERLFFRSAYGRFEKAYAMAHGERLELTEADAFLVYIEIYGYDSVMGQTEREMYGALTKIWKEIQLADRGNQVELIQAPEEVEETVHKPSLLKWFLPFDNALPQSLKIGFIYSKTAETSSWTYGHELGRLYLEEAMEGSCQTIAFDRADTDAQVEEAIDRAVAWGCSVIFTTASQMANQSLRSAIRYPDVKIYNCSVNLSYSSISTYYARVYESKFLMGALGAALAQENCLGYVADYPIYGTLANINAFAVGARMINPNIRIRLEWLNRKGGKRPSEIFDQEKIRLISGEDLITPESASRMFGLYRKHEDGSLENLATPIIHWGKFYERMIRIAFGNTEKLDSRKAKAALNYWWGMSADVIDIICSDRLPHATGRLIRFLKQSIRGGSFQPFEGMIRSQDGAVRCGASQRMRPEEILSMNWLAENVDGTIPEFDELDQAAGELLELQGVRVKKTD